MPYLGTPPQSGFISQEANQYFTGLTQNYIDLNQSISSISSVIILVNGVVQENSDLTLTSSTRITLGGTLVSADKVTCIYVAKISSTQAPATGSVTSDMLSGSIANSKLSSTAVDNTNTNSTLVTGQTAITSLADTDKFLVSDASDSGNLKYVEKQYVSSSYYVQLANVTISDGDSTEEIQSVFSSTYRNYLIVLEGLKVNTNSADLQMKFITSDGSNPSEHTWQAEGTFYNNTGNFWGGSNANNVTIMQGQGSGAGKQVSGFVNVFNPNSTTDGLQRYTWFVSARKHDSSNGVVYGGGNNATTTARTGFKFTVNSGTLGGGRIVVYGITNPS